MALLPLPLPLPLLRLNPSRFHAAALGQEPISRQRTVTWQGRWQRGVPQRSTADECSSPWPGTARAPPPRSRPAQGRWSLRNALRELPHLCYIGIYLRMNSRELLEEFTAETHRYLCTARMGTGAAVLGRGGRADCTLVLVPHACPAGPRPALLSSRGALHSRQCFFRYCGFCA